MQRIFKLLRLVVKDLFFPGIDFCLRKRLKLVKKYLRPGPIKTLDAGCGNGTFCFLSYNLGNAVLGIDINPENIKRCIEYREYKKMQEAKVKFMVYNIYNLLGLNETFEQIICFETLEHLLRDGAAIEVFSKLLNPGGTLHLGVPNLNCPKYYGERILADEDGAHVRKGYTYPMMEELFKGLNLKVEKVDGYGGIFTRKVTALSRRIEEYLEILPEFIGSGLRVFAFLILNPFTYLDKLFKAEWISIYILAKKNIETDG